MDSTQIVEEAGLARVRVIVRQCWWSKWQEFSQQNDDGVDGLILLCKRKTKIRRQTSKVKRIQLSVDTGAIIFAQIKSGRGYISSTSDEYIRINLKEDYIEKHRPRWNSLPGPAILIFVDTELASKRNPPAWWVDLRDERAYSAGKGLVEIPRDQRFDEHSKGHLLKLCGPGIVDSRLHHILAGRKDVAYIRLATTSKNCARAYYRAWSAAVPHGELNAALGPVTISRVGWRHITRRGRKAERILQSFQLLGVARRMIQEVHRYSRLGHAIEREVDGVKQVLDYVGLRARVDFFHRNQSVVQVVLKRCRSINLSDGTTTTRTWFYSVYELRTLAHG